MLTVGRRTSCVDLVECVRFEVPFSAKVDPDRTGAMPAEGCQDPQGYACGDQAVGQEPRASR